VVVGVILDHDVARLAAGVRVDPECADTERVPHGLPLEPVRGGQSFDLVDVDALHAAEPTRRLSGRLGP